ncbi:MAG: hypothetical protein K5829_10120 [Treponema sp.]|nr:hypothetical protein [Treponema sp.]
MRFCIGATRNPILANELIKMNEELYLYDEIKEILTTQDRSLYNQACDYIKIIRSHFGAYYFNSNGESVTEEFDNFVSNAISLIGSNNYMQFNWILQKLEEMIGVSSQQRTMIESYFDSSKSPAVHEKIFEQLEREFYKTNP